MDTTPPTDGAEFDDERSADSAEEGGRSAVAPKTEPGARPEGDDERHDAWLGASGDANSAPSANAAPVEAETADVKAGAGYANAEASVADAGPGNEKAWSSDAVAAAMHALQSVDQRPLGEHPDAFGSVHGELQRALADVDDA